MTQSNDIRQIVRVVKDADLSIPTRPEYFDHVAFVEQSLARAEDVNQMQRNIENGFAEFGADVMFANDRMRLAVVNFANRMAAQQANFEAGIQQQVNEFISDVNERISQWKQYADDGDAKTLEDALAGAKKYTDEQIKIAKSIALQEAWKATRTVVRAYASGINDGSNYFGGKPWGVPVILVPSDCYFLVTYFACNVLDLGDVGGAADEMSITWTPFFGLRQNASGNWIIGGNNPEQPTHVLPPRSSNDAFIYINNLRASIEFVLEGYMVPQRLIDAAVIDPNFPRTWMGPLAYQFPPVQE